jgi:hypothetical protein
MLMHKGGTIVEKGLYWNPVDGQRVDVQAEGILPGDESRRYLKISTVRLFVIAPLFGLSFVMFLPLFGVGVFLIFCLVPLVSALVSVAVAGLRVCSRFTGGSVFFSWNPSKAHFHGARKRRKEAGGSRTGGGQGR